MSLLDHSVVDRNRNPKPGIARWARHLTDNMLDRHTHSSIEIAGFEELPGIFSREEYTQKILDHHKVLLVRNP